MFKKKLNKLKEKDDFYSLKFESQESIRSIGINKSKPEFILNKNNNIKSKNTELKRKFIIFFFLIIIVFTFSSFILFFFKSATITYTLIKYKEKIPSENSNSIIFQAEPISNDENSKSISYKSISNSISQSIEIAKDTKSKKSIKSRGKIKIFNKQKKTQELIDTTQFKTEDGRIYRIVGDITIKPGESIIVDAYANLASEIYNTTENEELRVKNFSKEVRGKRYNQELYESVFALIIENFTGGINKEVATLSLEKREKEIAKIDKILKKELLKRFKKSIMELENKDKVNYIYFENLFNNIEKNTEELDFKINSDFQKVKRELSLTLPIFEINELNIFIIKSISEIGGSQKFKEPENWMIDNLNSLQFDYINPKGLNTEKFKFTLKGVSEIHYFFNEKLFSEKILGQDKKTFEEEKNKIFNKSIPKAFLLPPDLNNKPFWSNQIPDKLEKIYFKKRLSD